MGEELDADGVGGRHVSMVADLEEIKHRCHLAQVPVVDDEEVCHLNQGQISSSLCSHIPGLDVGCGLGLHPVNHGKQCGLGGNPVGRRQINQGPVGIRSFVFQSTHLQPPHYVYLL